MNIYTTLATFTIKNRGTVHVVEHHFSTDPRALTNTIVELDGEQVLVKGVGYWAIPYREQDKTNQIELLVSPLIS